jgi:hypothetical protein
MRIRVFSGIGILTLAAAVPVLVAGCETKGPAERAGERIDRGVQNARDALDPAGPMEKAGRAVDRSVNP